MIPKFLAVAGVVLLCSTVLFANSMSPEHWTVLPVAHSYTFNFTQTTGQNHHSSPALGPIIYGDAVLPWDNSGVLRFRGGDRGLFVGWRMQPYRGPHGHGRGRPKGGPPPTAVPDGDSSVALLLTTAAVLGLVRWKLREA